MPAERRIEPLFILTAVLLTLIACATPGTIAGQPAPATTALLPVPASQIPRTPPPTKSATRPPEPTPSPTVAIPPTNSPPPIPTPALASSPAVIPIGDPVVIGHSFGGRPIDAYRFGQGATQIVLVGGIHGGYEANSVELARRFIEYFRAGDAVPPGVTLHIIPDANPDGSTLVATTVATDGDLADTRSGRFNGRAVDLNRNWDCLWSPMALWRDQPVFPGDGPFSEPETQALRDYLLAADPVLVVFFHSAAGAVYGAGCPEPDPAALGWAEIYGRASGYPVFPIFDHYAITGDASDWLSTQGIPSFTVELTDHENIEWEQNLAGATAVIDTAAGAPVQPPPPEWKE